jgi:hypothetical protein
MKRGCVLVLILATISAAQSQGSAISSFPLEQPDSPIVAAFAGEESPLFGQTPPLRFVYYADSDRAFDPDDRAVILREIRFLRDYYRHFGLFLPIEERVYEVNAGKEEPRSLSALGTHLGELGLLGSGSTLVFSARNLDDAQADGVAATNVDSASARQYMCASKTAVRSRWCDEPEAERRDDVLRAAGRLFGIPGIAPRTGLRAREIELLKKHYAFLPPAPARDPFHRPALRDYRVTSEDFRMLERGLEGASKISENLFPDLIGQVDVVLYDTSDLYIYSRSSVYPFPKFKRWRGYQVYRVAHHSRPEEHEMWGCAGGLTVLSSDLRLPMGELYFACSPWGAFRRAQERRRSIYRFAEGYWASIIHEYGHQYQARMAANPTPVMAEIETKIESMKLDEPTSAYSAIREGFATWCELQGARLLYPEQYRRMMAEVKRFRRDDPAGHEAGLTAASAVIENDEAKARRAPHP